MKEYGFRVCVVVDVAADAMAEFCSSADVVGVEDLDHANTLLEEMVALDGLKVQLPNGYELAAVRAYTNAYLLPPVCAVCGHALHEGRVCEAVSGHDAFGVCCCDFTEQTSAMPDRSATGE